LSGLLRRFTLPQKRTAYKLRLYAALDNNRDMTTILLLHGGALNKEMWIPHISDLSAHVEIHSLDMPGHKKK